MVIYIEVKTTSSGLKTAFFVTANELECSRQYKDRYRLYRVYDFKNGKGKVKYIKGPLDGICIEPVSYKECLE